MDIDSLSSLLVACPYPSMMVAIDRGIEGNGYYPGARGFSAGSDPTGGVMLLGRDFGLYSYYARRSSIPNADETMYSWQHTSDCVLAALVGVGVWAVNYLLGARRSGPATGDLREIMPQSEWIPYEQHCWRFLCSAVLLQRPKFIVVLGANNARDLQRAERLDGPRYEFRRGEQKHVAEISYGPHPSSLRSRIVRERAREWYANLAVSCRA